MVDQVLDTSANPADTIPAAIDDEEGKYYPAWVASVHYWMDRMATTPTPLVEKMTFFWHGQLTSSTDGPLPRRVFRQIKTWRSLALGDIHDLMQAMAIDPAMLDYLDNDKNVAGKPNENFARELMELFTMGNGTFTEAEVLDMARAWTGHGTTSDKSQYQFTPAKHDNGSKTLFGITQNWDGPDTITEIVRGSKQAVCARFLATKIWSFFAAPNPTEALTAELTGALIAANMNAAAFLRYVFLHPEFRSPAVRTGLVRSPIEWQVATMRSVGLPAAVLHPEWWMESIGQELYRPPNVSGWRQNGAWISSSAQWGKGNYAGWVRWTARDQAGLFDGMDALPAPEAVQIALDQFGIDDPAPATRQHLETFAAGEKAANRHWAVAPGLICLCLLSPDFQLS